MYLVDPHEAPHPARPHRIARQARDVNGDPLDWCEGPREPRFIERRARRRPAPRASGGLRRLVLGALAVWLWVSVLHALWSVQ